MKPTHIVTHPGTAHIDDLMSVCVALAVWPINVVERRQPTVDEIEDPEVLVLDIGLLHDPERMCFDHHQYHKTAEAECALSLLAKSITWDGVNVHEAFSIAKWYESMKILDAKGIADLAQHLNINIQSIHATKSPLIGAMLYEFQKHPRREVQPTSSHPGVIRFDPFLACLQLLGRQILGTAVATFKQVQKLNQKCKIIKVEGVYGYVLESSDCRGSKVWRENQEVDLKFSITHASRSDGWVITRYDSKVVNLKQLHDHEDVEYVRPDGYKLKTKNRNEVQPSELVKLAIKKNANR